MDEWDSDEAYDDDDDDDDDGDEDFEDEEEDDVAIIEQDEDVVVESSGAPTGINIEEEEVEATPPADLCCPITKDIFVDPVMCVGDGETYERSAIEECLRVKQAAMDDALKELQETGGQSNRAIRTLTTGLTSPMGHGKLEATTLIPNHNSKRLVDVWRQQHGA